MESESAKNDGWPIGTAQTNGAPRRDSTVRFAHLSNPRTGQSSYLVAGSMVQFATTTAGGFHDPFPGGRTDGASVFGQ